MTNHKLSNLIENIKFDLGEGLIACDLWENGIGVSIAGYNSQPEATALFDLVTRYLDRTLEESNFDPLSEFYLLKLKNDSLVLVLLFESHTLGMLLNAQKVNLNYTFTSLISKIRENVTRILNKQALNK